MFKALLALVAALACFYIGACPALQGQDMVLNGNFELQARGPWALTGNNNNAAMAQFDVDNDTVDSWCWMKEPGTNGGNGGLEQDVLLVGGVTYQFDCNVAYYTC